MTCTNWSRATRGVKTFAPAFATSLILAPCSYAEPLRFNDQIVKTVEALSEKRKGLE